MRRIALVAAAVCLAGHVAAARADVARGIELFERGEFDLAAAELQTLAEAGVPVAQYVLGVMYLNMMVEPPAPRAAVEMITAAAETGHLPAQAELARMYRDGDGIEQDFGQMLIWYRRAAEQGDVGAQLFVADGYAYGYGIEADPVEAYMWYEIAIRYWGELAVRARDVLAETMTGAQVAEAERRAAEWLDEHPAAQRSN